MRRCVFAALLLLTGASASAETFEGPAPWRVGGPVGFTLDAFTVPESTSDVLELALRIPPATMALLSRDAAGEAHVRFTLRVKPRRGGRASESRQDLTLLPSDTLNAAGKVVVIRFPASPGSTGIDARLSDVLSKKPGLLNQGEGANEHCDVDASVTIAPPQEGRAISDVEFLWPGRPGDPSTLAFVRAGRVVTPNPERLYGLEAGPMLARFVARGARGAEARPWHWVARLLDAHGASVAERESTAAASTLLDALVAFDVSTLQAGAYDLELKVSQDGDARVLQRRGRFSVGWRPETWARNAADVQDEVHFLLSANEEEAFGVQPPGEQERILQDFWSRRDPTPETSANESYETFRARVAHANLTFSRAGRGKGMFSDMGRVYIRYGEPSEVVRQVIPTGSETLTAELQKIIDSESRMPDAMHQSGLGGDMRPFEVWIYEGNVPMPLDVDPHDAARGRTSRRLLFLFIDEQGLGTYRLRYSTE